ncbi:TrmH family RNA methyltransferase [Candidatus Electrothrix sp.]|uniref:TrmH family RNA methyltransferase n=1 Tax=Candidatus Electrothrix sp. TaxID=2170559 RepID=UPI004056C02C
MARRYNKRFDIAVRYEQVRRKNLISATPGVHEYILVLDGLKPDFNIGKIFRTADAFGAREIHLVGVSAFNPDSAKGSVRWVPFYHHEDFSSCYQYLKEKRYVCTVFEPGRSKLLGSCSLAKKSAFVMGHEEFGISFDKSMYPDIETISIPQWGHVQSLNVSVAASIVMYEYIRQYGRPISEGLPQKEAGVNFCPETGGR